MSSLPSNRQIEVGIWINVAPEGVMSENRKLAEILVADVVDVGADEDRALARLRTLRSDPITQS